MIDTNTMDNSVMVESPNDPPPAVFLVDDDSAVRRGIERLIESAGWPIACFASADEFLAGYDPATPGCLILDLMMPGMTGLELQEHLAEKSIPIPIVFITGHGDVPAAVDAIKAGAVDFLEKPFDDEALIRRVRQGIEFDLKQRRELGQWQHIEKAFLTLSPRELEVIQFVAKGETTRDIARLLFVGPRTVDLHRASIKRKLGARSLAHLMQMIQTLKTQKPSLFD
jgi:two-component system response regulator FixJ